MRPTIPIFSLLLATASPVAAIHRPASLSESVPIADGVDMPKISVGHPDDGSGMAEELELWLKFGGVGIDTAYDYHNQDQVAQGLAASGKSRDEVFITTKIPCKLTRKAALANIKEDLRELNVSYVDLMLIHFPCEMKGLPAKGNIATWLGLQDALAQNLTRAIGVSNFDVDHLKSVLALGGAPPSVNQCSMSVGNHDDTTISFCAKNNITYEAYSPLRHVNLSDERVAKIANNHEVQPAQVALKWVLQKDCILTTSPGTNEDYTKEDLALDGFTLTSDEMEVLSSM